MDFEPRTQQERILLAIHETLLRIEAKLNEPAVHGKPIDVPVKKTKKNT